MRQHPPLDFKAESAASMRSLLPALQRLAASRWLWAIAAVALILGRGFKGGSFGLDITLGDTDDATRIVQVHALLNGAGWFDTTLAKIGGATPLVSHWSRLIDAPLALLIASFGLFTSPDNALLLTRIIWPSLLLVVFFRLLMSEAEAREGAAAAVICLALAFSCLTGLFQFRTGRIDHHNAMIIGAVVGLAMLARSLDTPRLGTGAGIALGLALAVGYEPIIMILPLLSLAALAATIHTRWLAGVRRTFIALAITLAVAMIATVAPSNWLTGACDALALNMLFLVAGGATGLVVIEHMGQHWPTTKRIAVLAAAGAASLALYLAADPVCIGGPFARVGADARALWLVNVRETQSSMSGFADGPILPLTFLALMLTGCWAALSRWRIARTTESAATGLIMLAAVLPGLAQLKFLPYTSFIAVLVIALRIAMFQGGNQFTPRAARLAGVIALNQWTMALVASVVLIATGQPLDAADDGSDACYKTANVAPLSTLPPGLVASTANMGPYIAALTPHSVLAAPYHRIDRQIADAFRTFDSPLPDAGKLLAASGARYLVYCAKEARFAKVKPGIGSLAAILLTTETPSFLREIPAASPLASLRVFEIVPANR